MAVSWRPISFVPHRQLVWTGCALIQNTREHSQHTEHSRALPAGLSQLSKYVRAHENHTAFAGEDDATESNTTAEANTKTEADTTPERRYVRIRYAVLDNPPWFECIILGFQVKLPLPKSMSCLLI